MFSYPDTFIVVGLGGEKFELKRCRVDSAQIIYTKDTSVKVQSGSKLIRKHQDGLGDCYFVKNVSEKTNLLGSIEIHVTRI